MYLLSYFPCYIELLAYIYVHLQLQSGWNFYGMDF